jgi:hypothetical protein
LTSIHHQEVLKFTALKHYFVDMEKDMNVNVEEDMDMDENKDMNNYQIGDSGHYLCGICGSTFILYQTRRSWHVNVVCM